jgi:tetratricopeptide (TPR) repeat protein
MVPLRRKPRDTIAVPSPPGDRIRVCDELGLWRAAPHDILIARGMRSLALGLALLFASAAVADESPDVGAAKARFAAGTSFFKQRRFRDAIGEFLEAYRLSRAKELLYNIAACYEALDDPGRAAIYFGRYLAVRPEAAERGEIEQSLRRVSSRVGRLVLHVPPGAAVTVDGVPIEIPPPAPLPVTRGRHRIEATAAGASPAVLDVEVAGGLLREATLLPAVGGSVLSPQRPRRRWIAPVVVTAAVVVVAAVAVGVALSVGGTDYHADGLSLCANHPGCQVLDLGGGQ